MTLLQAQQQFAIDLARLILWCEGRPYAVTFGEAYRTPEQAALYAKQGKGIINSNHTRRLAVDLNLFVNGVYATDSDAYAELGEFWESMNVANVWGGNFKRRDGNHFSRRYGGYPV
jgi:hypothetical protein